MKALRGITRTWAALAALAAILIAVYLSQHGMDGHVYIGDDSVDGPMGVVIAAFVGAFVVFLLGMVFSVLCLAALLIVPAVLIIVLVALMVPVLAIATITFGGAVLVFSPLLLVIFACVLLSRLISRKSRAPRAAPQA